MTRFFNSSVLDQAVPYKMDSLADDAMPTLAVAYSLTPQKGDNDPTSQVDGATITIDADGGTSSELLITLNVNKVTEAGVATTDSTTTINGATSDTLSKVIDAINAVEGFTAWALHGPHNMDTGNDNFIDLAETEIRNDGKPVQCLYRDADQFQYDSDYVNWLRIGWPEERDSGHMRLMSLSGTSTGETNGTMKVFRDVYGGSKTELFSRASAAAQTEYIDRDASNSPMYHGPLLVELKSDNLTGSDIICTVLPAEW